MLLAKITPGPGRSAIKLLAHQDHGDKYNQLNIGISINNDAIVDHPNALAELSDERDPYRLQEYLVRQRVGRKKPIRSCTSVKTCDRVGDMEEVLTPLQQFEKVRDDFHQDLMRAMLRTQAELLADIEAEEGNLVMQRYHTARLLLLHVQIKDIREKLEAAHAPPQSPIVVDADPPRPKRLAPPHKRT